MRIRIKLFAGMLAIAAATTAAPAHALNPADVTGLDYEPGVIVDYTLTVTETDLVTAGEETIVTDAVYLADTQDIMFNADALTITQGATSCSPGGKALTGTLTARDGGGDIVFKFHHDLDFYYNCTNVTRIVNQNVYFTDTNEGWQGKSTSKSRQGVDTAHATAIGTGHAARYCTPWGCVSHANRAIKWDLYGKGGYKGQGG